MSTIPAAQRGARPATETGMLLMAAAMLVAPALDALAKLLTASLSPGEIVLGRFVFQTAFIAPFVLIRLWRRGACKPAISVRRPRILAFYFMAGVLIGGAVLLLVWALRSMPVANAISIFFVEPLVLTLFSAALLGEPVGWRRFSATAIGLLGALIVIRPNWAAFGWVAILPFCTATAYAGYLTVMRHVAPGGDRVILQLWLGLFAALALATACYAGSALDIPLLALSWPSPWQWAVMAGIGAISMITHLLIAQAFARAPAPVLAPFQYLEIFSATILGLILFGDFPDAMTWFGTAVIIGAGLYVFHRERRLARRPAPPPVA